MKYQNSIIQCVKQILIVVLLILINQAALANSNTPEGTRTNYYSVVDGKVDSDTFIGYNVYHYACVRCHGVGGVGSDLAPDLTESVTKLSPEQFRIKVLHKLAIRFTSDDWMDMEQAMFEEILKQEHRDKGELANMPRWENNPVIKKNVQNIYRYLKARSDNAIGPEKPELIKE